jgi:hypothetical protein
MELCSLSTRGKKPHNIVKVKRSNLYFILVQSGQDIHKVNLRVFSTQQFKKA